MAFLRLKSTNPNFSYVIKKNPASGLQARELRKGSLFGHFSDNGQTYNAFFRDAFNDISYPECKDQEFEYVNATRFSSSQFISNALAELFRDSFKKQQELDIDGEYENSVVLNMIYLESQRIINAFLQHFDTCQIEVQEVAAKSFKVTITTRKSIYYLLNLVNLFAAFNTIRNKNEYLFIDEMTIEKYFQALTVIDPPYFIRYNFKLEMLRGGVAFNKYKQALETSSRYPMTFVQGDTVAMRLDAVQSHLDFSNHIVDIGCGEGRYIWPLTRRLHSTKGYYAIDKDQDCRDAVARKVRLKELTNVHVLDSIDTFLETVKVEAGQYFDFILGEVIEHMPLEEAAELIKKCLTFTPIKKMIITTPNAEFNQHYFDAGMRHSDHVFEFKTYEFESWISDLAESFGYSSLVFGIGDVVAGQPTSLGAVIY